MTGRPAPTEAAPYYHTYIDRISSEDVLDALESQIDPAHRLFATITEQQSLHRYAPDKWSIRQLLNHVSDTERVFLYRALWFARGFDTPLPGFDQNIAVPAAAADQFSWASHVADFAAVRAATLSFFRNLPGDALDFEEAHVRMPYGGVLALADAHAEQALRNFKQTAQNLR